MIVRAEASGTIFTANPINGARDEIVIDAAWGLGEAIVGGLVTPDQVLVDKVTGAIKQVIVADKTVMTQPTATGTEERPVEESKRRAQVPYVWIQHVLEIPKTASGKSPLIRAYSHP